MSPINLAAKITVSDIKLAVTILGVILAVSFIVYTIIFILHSYLYKKEINLKIKFNQLSQYNFINQTKYLLKLSVNNQAIKKIIDHIETFNIGVQNITKNLAENLETLTIINKHYLIVRSSKLCKQINQQIEMLEANIKAVQEIIFTACSYTKSAEKMISSFREITQSLSQFYNDKIPNQYHNEQIKNIFINIRDQLTEANYVLMRFDNKNLINIIDTIGNDIVSLHAVLFNLFSLAKSVQYISELEKTANAIKKKVVNLNTNEKNEYEKRIIEGRIQLGHILNNISRLDFGNSRISVFLAITAFNKAINVIELNEKTIVLFEQHFQVLKSQVAILQKEYDDIIALIKSIKECMHTTIDQNETYVDNFRGYLNAIFSNYNKLEKKVQNKNSPTIDVVSTMHALINNIIDWKKMEIKFCEHIKDKYAKKINLINEIYNVEFQLTQLYSLQEKVSFDTPMVNQIVELIKQTQELTQTLFDNYLYSYAEVEQQLFNIKIKIGDILANVRHNDTLSVYNQRLIQYASKFYHEAEQNKQTIDHATSLYKQKKYQESLNCLIGFLQQIKKISKEHNINIFN